jgi:hypothetical protein
MPDTGNKRFLSRTLIFVLGLLLCGLAFWRLETGEAGNNGTFKLREVSVFDSGKDNFLRGQMCRCQNKPFPEVRNYPVFTSQVPIFGSVRFDGRVDDINSGTLFYFAVDESRGTGKGYDRFYFDANRDLDLRNDLVGKLQQPPPDHGYAPRFSGIKAVAAFDFLKLSAGTNSSGTAPVEVMPRLLLTGDEKQTYRFMFFVRTHFYEGDIRIAGKKFHAQLGDDYSISSNLNFPGTALVLSRGKTSFNWWGGDRIAAMQKVNGRFYRFSAGLDGELSVQPYARDLGTFEVGAGKRMLTNLSVSGSFQGSNWNVPVNDISARASCQVPIGDYLPAYLSVRLGRLSLSLSQNYHSDGKRVSRDGRPPVYGISIRKDRPYTLDFSNQPEVMFTSPTNQQRIKPGETLMVAAVLVDPKLDIMIRRLEDTSRKQTKDAEDKPLHYERNLSLDPTVIITRANGKKVAEGVMPFG